MLLVEVKIRLSFEHDSFERYWSVRSHPNPLPNHEEESGIGRITLIAQLSGH